ncbi:hypothetical protein B0O99DRAFT_700043 [Bisporella sp. PMI_857]|nr:hypothetical protein B0O99DRAFT_700043 [Bisporella sp. PMI_857]
MKLVSTDGIYVNWLRLYDPDKPRKDSYFQKQIVLPQIALYYAASGGLVKLTGQLIENGANPNAQGGRYGNALQAVSANGYDKIAELLLSNGANPNAQGEDNSNVKNSSLYSHRGTVESMLRNGPGPHPHPGEGHYGNALERHQLTATIRSSSCC